MNADLKNILEQKVAEKTPGTFHLGRGQGAQRILFDGTLFQFYSEPTAQHFPDVSDWSDVLAPEQLDSLLALWYTESRDLEVILSSVKDLDESVRNKICQQQAISILIDAFTGNGEGFLFEEQSDHTVEITSGIDARP